MAVEESELDVLEFLSNRDVMAILHRLSDRPTSAKDLAAQLDLSRKTIYRHVHALVSHGLVREEQIIDEGGNHYAVYETAVDEVDITISPAAGEVDVEKHPKDTVGGFVTLWSGMCEQTGTDRR